MMHLLPSGVRLLALALLTGVPCYAQSLWVVDAANGPGADTTTIIAALTLASDGDTLLVRDGSYPDPILIDDLSVSIVADQGANVGCFRVDVLNLSGGKQVTLRGLASASGLFGQGANLTITNCTGPVHIEGCLLEAGSVLSAGAVRLTNCDAVTLSHCDVVTSTSAGLPSATFTIVQSTAALFECTVEGLDGSTTFIGPSAASSAVSVLDSIASFSACTLCGGDGGGGFTPNQCFNGGIGFPALSVADTGAGSTAVEVIDSIVTGGLGGTTVPPCVPGLDADPISDPGGFVVLRSGVAPRFTIDSPLRSGQLFNFSLEATPGSLSWLLLGVGPGPILPYDPLLTGVSTTGAPSLLIPFFQVPGSGVLDSALLPGTIAIPIGLSHLPLYFQPITSEPTFKLIAGSPSSLLVLDPAL